MFEGYVSLGSISLLPDSRGGGGEEEEVKQKNEEKQEVFRAFARTPKN